MAENFTLTDSVGLEPVMRAATSCARVRRLIPDDENGDGLIVEGIARSIGDERGCAMHGADVREQFLRVTSLTGFEHFWSVRKLMAEARQSCFVIDN